MSVESVGPVDTTIATGDVKEEQAQQQSTWNGRNVTSNPQTTDLKAALEKTLKQQQTQEDETSSLDGRVDDDAETYNPVEDVAETAEPQAAAQDHENSSEVADASDL